MRTFGAQSSSERRTLDDLDAWTGSLLRTPILLPVSGETQRPAEDELTWIFGSSRSGSTWLLRMLAGHPDVMPIDETGIGHHLGVWRPIALAWATSDDPPPLTTFAHVKRGNPDYLFSERYREGSERLLRRFILDRLGLQRADPVDPDAGPQTRIVIKEPGGSHMADWILSLLPGSRLVFLLRDGRDVVDSWLDAYQPGAWGTEDGAYPLSPAARLPFIRWQATVWRYRTDVVRRAYEAHDPARRVLVRYEDLLADPARELARVHQAVGLDSGPDEIAAVVDEHSYGSVPDAERGQGKPVRWAQPGRWCESLSDEEKAAMDDIIGDQLRELGYER